jgi:hypothetical protein
VGVSWTLKSGASFDYLSFHGTFADMDERARNTVAVDPTIPIQPKRGRYYNAVVRPACYAKTV